MPATKNNNTIAEYEAILEVVKGYVEGLRTGNVAMLNQAFLNEGIMVGYMPDGNLVTKLQFLYDFTDENESAQAVESHLSILHKTDTAAVVLVELEELQGGTDSTDYLSLLKVDGEWKIISKVFNLYWS